MKKFVVYNEATGLIVASGHCQDRAFVKQAGKDEVVMEGVASDVRQKIVDGKIVDKTLEEIERDNPKTQPVPFEKRRANITNEQLQNILTRLERLEAMPLAGR
jgi:hypothetical protein